MPPGVSIGPRQLPYQPAQQTKNDCAHCKLNYNSWINKWKTVQSWAHSVGSPIQISARDIPPHTTVVRPTVQ